MKEITLFNLTLIILASNQIGNKIHSKTYITDIRNIDLIDPLTCIPDNKCSLNKYACY